LPGCEAPRDNPLDPRSPNYQEPGPPLDTPADFNLFQIRTRHLPEDPALSQEEQILARAEALVEDPDGVASVHLEIGDTLRFEMSYDPVSGLHSYNFNPNQFGQTIFDYIGTPFYAIAYDDEGHVTRSEKEQIVRVIEQVPEILEPKTVGATPDTAGLSPLLLWREFPSRFPVTYTVAIRNLQASIVFLREGVPRVSAQGDTVDSLRLTSSLTDGAQYYWIVTVVDQFGNESSSRAAIFRASSQVGNLQP
jgi:hypothetical protein